MFNLLLGLRRSYRSHIRIGHVQAKVQRLKGYAPRAAVCVGRGGGEVKKGRFGLTVARLRIKNNHMFCER